MIKGLLSVILGAAVCLFFLNKNVEAQEMIGNQNLNARQQAIIPIAAFTAGGELDKLKVALNEGLDAGLTVNEIKEVLVQMYAYAGFPRSLNGLGLFMEVVKERQAEGINDEMGPEASPLPAGKTRLELGTENQTTLSGQPVTGELFEFAPAIDFFLKDHLFGDIFGRDNLNFQNREIATISALSNIKGVNSQLQSHFNIGMNTGLTREQMRNLVDVLNNKVGKDVADNAEEVLEKVLSSRSN